MHPHRYTSVTHNIVYQLYFNKNKKKKPKTQEKWITYPNVKCKLIKFLEDSIRENSDNLELGGDFLDTIPKA